MSLRSGAGVDGLQARCATGIFGELDWSPGIHQQCLDAQTEILTQRGFLGPDDFQDEDLVAAYDPATAAVQWLPVKNRVDRRLADGEKMFECIGPSLDIRVTGGHRMLARKEAPWRSERRPPEFVQAEELAEWKTAYKIPVAGFEEVSREAILTDDEIRLIGWYITDGSLNARSRQLVICQSEASPHCVDIEQCLVGADMHYSVSRTKAGSGSQFNRRSDLLRFSVPKCGAKGDVDWRGWLRIEPYLDKDLSPLLEKLSRRQLGLLLEAMHMGDGAKWLTKSYSISIGRKDLADRLQSLCVRRGFRANLFPRVLPSGKTHYNLGIKDMQHKHVGPKASKRKMSLQPSHSEPGERVWCVENDLGTLFIRRNGKAAVVGNCIWRLDREGQTSPVTAFFLVTDDGSDPPIMDVLGIKASEAQSIVDPYLGVEVKENDTSHLRRLVERYLDRKKGAA